MTLDLPGSPRIVALNCSCKVPLPCEVTHLQAPELGHGCPWGCYSVNHGEPGLELRLLGLPSGQLTEGETEAQRGELFR